MWPLVYFVFFSNACHLQVILYARSKTFRDFLIQNPNATEFFVTSTDPELIKILLYFIYTDTLPPLQSGIEYHLLKAAKEFVPEKVERVIQCLTNGMLLFEMIAVVAFPNQLLSASQIRRYGIQYEPTFCDAKNPSAVRPRCPSPGCAL